MLNVRVYAKCESLNVYIFIVFFCNHFYELIFSIIFKNIRIIKNNEY